MYLGLGCRGLGLLLAVCAGVWMAADLVVWGWWVYCLSSVVVCSLCVA